uniref:Uncharacterized protein n=1 Tax=Anguilla anguilla TaxID=7936 RepID=A0A0E9T7T1_ANGAN
MIVKKKRIFGRRAWQDIGEEEFPGRYWEAMWKNILVGDIVWMFGGKRFRDVRE